MASNANVQQFSWNGSAAQCWKFVDAGNGNYYIQSKLGTVLDIQNGTIRARNNVQVFELNKTFICIYCIFEELCKYNKWNLCDSNIIISGKSDGY